MRRSAQSDATAAEVQGGDCASRVHHPKRAWLALAVVAHRLAMLRRFRSLRVMHDERLAQVRENAPLIVYVNHPSWWDTLSLLHLQMELMPERVAYYPTDSKALERSKLLYKLGSFPLYSGSVSGTRKFIDDCRYVLSFPDAVLFVTPEGVFTDPRKRPLELRRGLASVISRLKNVTVIPLAIEYTLWEKDRLEVLTSWGEPVWIEDGSQRKVNEWHAVLTESLTRTMDELAQISIKREHWKFRVVVIGSLGSNNLSKLASCIRRVFQHRRPARASG